MRDFFRSSRMLIKGNLPVIAIFVIFIFMQSLGLAQAQSPIMIGLGDSIGEGVQSADANFASQPFSYINLLASRIGFGIDLPLIGTSATGMVGDTSNRFRLMPFGEASNLSVSGADVNSLINDKADALSVEEIDSETDLVLFPRLGSQLEIAEFLDPLLTICWIGNNDVLSAVISFDQLDATQMTPVQEFQSDFQEIGQRLIKPGKVVVFANIPDVTNIAFLMERHNLIKFLGSDYGLAEGEFTSLVVMLLIRLGLDDGSLLSNPNFVLDAEEIQLIQERIEDFNQIIEETAWSFGMPVVDINALFHEIVKSPPSPFGLLLTARFLGGIFSLDGVHPSNFTHAIITNAFIETINSSYNANIPPIGTTDLLQILITDPFIDKDGDGRVTGRFGAGLLETLGPFLGISGDRNDWVSENFQALKNSEASREFMERYLAFKEKDLHMASKWDKNDVIEAFKDIFGLSLNN